MADAMDTSTGAPSNAPAAPTSEDVVMGKGGAGGAPSEGLRTTLEGSAASHFGDRAASGSEGGGSGSGNAPERQLRDRKTAPVVKLSVALIGTYKHINQVYYEQKKKRQAAQAKRGIYNNGWDDENYDLKYKTGDCVQERFVIDRALGKGSFGQVVRAYDKHQRVYVALKIIKSKKPFFQQAKSEIAILKMLKKKDPSDQCFCVRMVECFVWRNHQCLVFELLSYNLYDLLRNTNFHGVSLNLIRKFARQILTSLAFLSLQDVNIIHCDLKPENILLRHPKRSAIKVIDFGSSCRASETLYSYIQSRFYRSPEVILGLPYGHPIDVWSLGCILVEMHTGEPIFPGEDEGDQLARIVDVLGVPPPELLHRSPKWKKFFISVERGSFRLRRPRRTPSGKTVADIIGVHTSGPAGRRRGEPGHSVADYECFCDMIVQMLDYDPRRRITPLSALKHPFLASGKGAAKSSSGGSSRQSAAAGGAGSSSGARGGASPMQE